MVVAIALLALILSLLSTAVQRLLRRCCGSAGAVIVVAISLAGLFCAAAASVGALNVPLALVVIAYVLTPTVVTVARGANGRADLFDLAAILLLWLPLEFGVGQDLVPRPVQGIVHAVAYGIAIALALTLFLIYRRFDGMKYNVPRSAADLRYAAVGFACAAAVLIPLGIVVGFLETPHTPEIGPITLLKRILFIFAATALPEEILFRSLIQNWLVQRLGPANHVIALSAVIFGLSHLNNGPAAAPNWPYAIVASFAGFIFGKVFAHSTTVVSSALVHTGVNTVKHLFF